MLIINPPLAKPCEPPAALAYLSASLVAHGHTCITCDMNIEGLHYLLARAPEGQGTWSVRALKHLSTNLNSLQSPDIYDNFSRYSRAVMDINRVLETAGRSFDLKLSLANYQDKHLSPLRSADLRWAAGHYQENIFFPYFKERLNLLCPQNSDNIVGFSLSYLSQALCTFAIIGYLRAHYPEVRIILGGGLITTWLCNRNEPNPFADLVDVCIAGRGEAPLLHILGSSEQRRHSRPSYDALLPNNYLAPGFILPYTTSFGCFWKKCSFCPEVSENNRYQAIPPATVLADLKTLIAETSPTMLHLLDNAISPKILAMMCENPLGVPWYGFVRMEHPLTELSFCKKLRDSGCVMLKLGLESGDQDLLDTLNKGIDLENASQVLCNLHAAGIATYVYLLFGTPAETREQAEKTRQFVLKHHGQITFLNLAIFNLPIASALAKDIAVTDFFEGDLSLYHDFLHAKGWNRAAVRHYLQTVFRRSPQIAAILRRDPPFFTSNHAPFMKSLQTKSSSGSVTTNHSGKNVGPS